MKQISCFLFFFLAIIPVNSILKAQNPFRIFTEKLINTSEKGITATYELKQAQLDYTLYKKQQLPELTLRTIAPFYNKTAIKVLDTDGSEYFVNQRLTSYYAELQLAQPISKYGTQLYINSSFETINLLNNATNNSYLTRPVNFGFTQPLIGIKSFQKDELIQLQKAQSAEIRYQQIVKQLEYQAIEIIFDYLSADQNVETKHQKLIRIEKTLKIAQQLRKSENELLQIQLNKTMTALDYEQAKLNFSNKADVIKNAFDGVENLNFQLQLLKHIKFFSLPIGLDSLLKAVEKKHETLKQNNYEQTQLEKQFIQNQYSGFRIDLSGQWGFFSDNNPFDAPVKLKNQQIGSISLQIPLMNWSKNKIKKQITSEKLLAELNIADESKKSDVILVTAIVNELIFLEKKHHQLIEIISLIQKQIEIEEINTTDYDRYFDLINLLDQRKLEIMELKKNYFLKLNQLEQVCMIEIY